MKKITLCLMIILALIVVPKVTLAATVTAQEQFITAVENGEKVDIKKDLTIKLEKDLTISNIVTIGAYSGTKNTVTLDLNGHTINFSSSSAYIYVQNVGKLIINDSVGNGLITNAGAKSGYSYLIQVKGGCEINGGTIENTLSSKYALYLQGDTKVASGILNGGTIKNSCTGSGRAVSVGKGTFTMNGGKVENNAAGYDGLVPAIQGGEIKIVGGTIESAGTGIQSSNANVSIIGGTIKAGWFGLHTSNAVIKPAEGKKVNIIVPIPEREKDNAAIMLAYKELNTGEGNKIYGGNFEAPMFMETTYACEPENMKVYGGVFNHEVSKEYLAPGYVVNKVNDKYKVELNVPNIVDDEIKADKEVEMEVFPEIKEQLKEIFEKEINENEAIQEALLEGKKVDIHIQLEKVEENDVKEDIQAIKETAKDKKIANVYDITLVVEADGTQIDTIAETSSKLKFKVLIPEDLLKDNRTFFMYRYHNGKVEEIKGEIDENNYFVFESDRFSTYVLAYVDKVEEPTESGQGTAKPEDKDEEVSEDKKDEILEDNKEEITKEDNKDEVTEDKEEILEDNKDEVTEDKEEILEDNKDEVTEDKNEKTKEKGANVPKTGDVVVFYVVLAVISVFGITKVKKANTSKSKH